MDIRYQKNIDNDIFNTELQDILLTKNIAVIGCGGQGGYILEYLVRLGVNSIIFWDGDVYSKSNLNRQIGCTENTIGQNKVKVLYMKLKEINSEIHLYPRDWFFGDKESDFQELMTVDFIFYAADCYYNIYTLRPLLRKIIENNIPLIDCPVKILGGSIYIETSEDLGHFDFTTEALFHQYKENNNIICSQPAYKCALIAAEAVNQMVLYFKNSRYACIDTELFIDIYHHKYTQSDKYGIF